MEQIIKGHLPKFIMLKQLMLILFLSICFSSLSAQQLSWAFSQGGDKFDAGKSICSDASGNIYIVGYFFDTVDFDPGSDTNNLISQGSSDIYIQKLDASGNLIWVKSIGGVGGEFGSDIEVDALGNIYILGIFSDTIDFDPGPNDFFLESNGLKDIYILKMDSSGNFLWARSMGTSLNDEAQDIAVDNWGNIYTTGRFDGFIDFDPSPTSSFNVNSTGLDVFIQKLDAFGNFVWVQTFGNFLAMGMSIVTDDSGNVYSTGTFTGVVDMDPGIGVYNLTTSGNIGANSYVQKLDPFGNLVWARKVSEIDSLHSNSIVINKNNEIILSGHFKSSADFDTGPDSLMFNTTIGKWALFTLKMDNAGVNQWVKVNGQYDTISILANHTLIDQEDNIINIGDFFDSVDIDPGPNDFYISALQDKDIYIQKLDANGNFISGASIGGTSYDYIGNACFDPLNNLYIVGTCNGTIDLDPGPSQYWVNNEGYTDIFVVKLEDNGIRGKVFLDVDQDCIKSSFEPGLENVILIINPGNIVTTTNSSGLYFIDSLAAGTYTITVDTSNSNWIPTCPVSQTFTVINPDSSIQGPDFGFIYGYPCSQPDVSIVMPQMRRGFSNLIQIQACNEYSATNIMDSAYCVVELPIGLLFLNASIPYIDLGNNRYSFYLGTLYPGQCINFMINAVVSLANNAGATLCLEAQLYPQDSCVFDTTYNPYNPSPSGSVSPCTTSWDGSSLMVEGACIGDSVRFVIYNTGDPVFGDMSCYAPVRVYVDGQFYLLDSIQLAGGDSIVFMFEGNGSTWILQADQHPLHPGNSNPNAHVENCGSGTGNGTGVVIQFPSDDADPVIDIYCGQVTAPLDPNDKTGFPGGLSDLNYIEQNQRLEYLIRFQNVGTDTAFNIVIRDTLSTDLNIFSVVSEASSHDYSFRIYGPRILEWTFSNIMLPDSNVNEAASHGFIKFKVDQINNLPFGTVIENSAAIYFDFEAPVITNTYFHTIHDFSMSVSVDKTQSPEQLEARLMPNPVSDQAILILEGLSGNNLMDIHIYDITGQMIRTISGTDNSIPIDVNGLVKGMYVLQVLQDGKFAAVLRMIVN